jgi:hypothetical protein
MSKMLNLIQKRHMMYALLLGGANLVKKRSVSAEVLLLIEQAAESTKVHQCQWLCDKISRGWTA